MNSRIIIFLSSLIIITLFAFSLKATSPTDTSITEISRLNSLLNKAQEYQAKSFAKSQEYAFEAQSLSKKLKKPYELAKATKVLGIANYYQGNYNESLEYYEQAILLFEELGNKKDVAKVLNNIGVIYERWCEYNTSHSYYHQSLKIYEDLKDTLGIAGSYNNIGSIYFYMHEYKKTHEYYKKSVLIFEEYDDKQQIANTLNNIGYVYEIEENYSEALNYYKRALEIRKEIIDNYGIGVSLNNIGVIYFLQQRYNESLNYLLKAYQIRKDLNHVHGMASTGTTLGELYYELKQNDKAIEYLEQAEIYASTNNMKDKLINIYNCLHNIYISKNQYKKSLEYLTLACVLKDSVFEQNKMEKISELETKYQKVKNEQKIKELQYETALKEAKIQKMKRVRDIFIINIVFLIVIVFLVYNRYRNKKRNETILSNKNLQLAEQHQQIKNQNKKIKDSIIYASHLLNSILPQKEYITSVFPDHFVLDLPKDIVSGDFYWIRKNKNMIAFAVADCTGHGVPGAIMSMLGMSFLNEILGKKTKIKPNDILNELREKIKETLHQTGKKRESKDGIDISLCILNTDTLELQFSGAFNGAFIIHKNELQEFKGDKMPIGIYVKKVADFSLNSIVLKPGDSIYLTTDGYSDQFGGENNAKFSSQAFKNLIHKIHEKPLFEQKKILSSTLNSWKVENEQVDDILVIGIKI